MVMMASQRVSFSSGRLKDIAFIKNVTSIKALLSKKLVFFKASSLGSVNYEDSVLENLEKLLLKAIPDAEKVKLSVLNSDGFFSSFLKVNIVRESSPKKWEYEGVFVSTSQGGALTTSRPKLPLLCVSKGLNKVHDLHPALQSVFNCFITQYPLSPDSFNWLLGITLFESIRRKQYDDLEMEYTLPEGCIEFILPEPDIVSQWKSIIAAPDVVQKSEIDLFVSYLKESIETIFGLNVGHFALTKFKFGDIVLQKDSKLMMSCSSPQQLYCLLSFLESSV